MAIKIDYAAWETWQPEKYFWHRWQDFNQSNAERFGFESYIHHAKHIS